MSWPQNAQMPGDGSMNLAGRVAAIATKHDKATLFAPPLRDAVGLTLVTADVDTDLLGTFTGEIPRAGTAVDTARQKARLAIDHTGKTIGVGSEGSFGPHPAIPFIAADVEVVVLLDTELGLDVTETFMTTDTNYRDITVDTPAVDESILERMGFPQHALVVSPVVALDPLSKGVTDIGSLHAAIRQCISQTGSARIRTDMRAHLNPSRRTAIAALAERLAHRLFCRCPRCDAPGWGIIERRPGLPCSDCGTATELTGHHVEACARPRCGHVRTTPMDGHATAANCPTCNP